MPTAASMTWQEAVEAFAEHQRAQGLAESTVDRQVRQLRTASATLGNTPATVTPSHVEAWIATHPAAPRTVKSARMTLRAFYRWAEAVGIVEQSPMPAMAPVTRYTVDQRWQDALQAFEIAQGRARMAPATIALRLKHLTRLAADAEHGPWDTTAAELSDWLDGLPGGERTRLSHRVSVRAFYRWAHASQHIATNPTDEHTEHKLRLPVPPRWAPELEAYMRAQRAEGRPPTTMDTRRRHLERFARDNHGREPYELTLDDLLVWFAGKRWAAETRRSHRASVVSFYRWAEATARVQVSPAAELPRVRPSEPRPRPALEHELAEALAKATPRERLAVRLAAELGLRRAEVARVHSSDLVTLPGDGQWWLVVHGKGQRQRRLPLTDDLASSLRALPPGWAFPGGDEGHLSPGYIGKLVTRLLPPGVTMHALRHRFATRAYNIDRDVFAVQHFLGHSSPAVTQRYVLVADDRLRSLGAAVNAS